MRNITAVLIFWSHFPCLAQNIRVSNQSPNIATDFKKYLYVNFDNPIYITTGNIKSLEVSIDNGTIASTQKKGSYLVKPETVGEATIILSGQNFKKTFLFQVRSMRYPAIRLLPSINGGMSYGDGVISVNYSSGIATYYTPSDVDVDFQIDSFTVEIRDSLNTSCHVNIGQLWDGITKAMIQNAKPKSFFLIHKVYMSRNGRRLKSDAYLESYIW